MVESECAQRLQYLGLLYHRKMCMIQRKEKNQCPPLFQLQEKAGRVGRKNKKANTSFIPGGL